MKIAVHVTHEAIQKIGGIGTVLHGLLTTEKYKKLFPTTLLYSPLFDRNAKLEERLGRYAEVYYSGLDNFDAADWGKRFRPIEEKYGVKIVYGKKAIGDALIRGNHSKVDAVAVYIWEMSVKHASKLKYQLWKYFGIQSDKLEGDHDFEQYLRIGVVIRNIFESIYGKEDRAVIFSHEYMGMPSALAFEIDKIEQRRQGDVTVFYAHEVATARLITENHPGHDLAFYNIMSEDTKKGISLEEEFGYFPNYSRNELIKRAHMLDHIFAVSDITKGEYLYLCPDTDSSKIKVVYNAIPTSSVSYENKKHSHAMVREYCKNLYSFTPDYIFTHVTRLIISKALWRDIRFLYHLDETLSMENKTGFFVILSTLIGGGRPSEAIRQMESEYGWPVAHREGWPDLVGSEIDIYNYLKLFNARSKAIKGVFINQFGFNEEKCGDRIPKGASILDLRLASDIEFGMSIYEPFGIAQLETLPYGGFPVISSVCGCACLLEKTLERGDYLSIDFTKIPKEFWDVLKEKKDFKAMSKEMRDLIETEICAKHAAKVASLLPQNKSEHKKRFDTMQDKAHLLGWEHVAERIGGYLDV